MTQKKKRGVYVSKLCQVRPYTEMVWWTIIKYREGMSPYTYECEGSWSKRIVDIIVR